MQGQALVGSLFAGSYEIEAVLGEGAMGTVYRARHVRIGRTFALKVLHRGLTRSKIVQRFEREAELAGRLTHPNTVPVVDLDNTEGGDLYLVMDFVEGSALSELLVETPMPASRVLPLARQLCDGLDHAHALGLVHRDFKPENVIVTRDSRGAEVPRIVDFGMAILREEMADDSGNHERLTTGGMVVGTPHYMSPEQVRGEAIDGRSDLFALGIILFELLTGRLPFDGDGVDVARANLEAQTPRMRHRATTVEVDPVLEALVGRLMEKDPARRPQSAREVRELLDLVDSDRLAAIFALGLEPPAPAPEPPTAKPPTAEPPTAKPPTAEPPTAEPPTAEPPTAKPPTAQPLTAERRELRTGKRDPLPRTQSLRIAIIGAVALLVLALLVRVATRPDPQPAAASPVVAQPSIVTVTVPLPIAVERPAPAPVPAPTTTMPPPTSPTTPASVPASHVASQKPAAMPAARTPGTIPTAAELAALYREVGQALEQLERDKADSLWQRYRWIRIGDYLMTPDKRAEAAAMLDAIASDARGK